MRRPWAPACLTFSILMNVFHCLLNNTQSENENSAFEEESAVCARFSSSEKCVCWITSCLHAKPEKCVKANSLMDSVTLLYFISLWCWANSRSFFLCLFLKCCNLLHRVLTLPLPASASQIVSSHISQQQQQPLEKGAWTCSILQFVFHVRGDRAVVMARSKEQEFLVHWGYLQWRNWHLRLCAIAEHQCNMVSLEISPFCWGKTLTFIAAVLNIWIFSVFNMCPKLLWTYVDMTWWVCLACYMQKNTTLNNKIQPGIEVLYRLFKQFGHICKSHTTGKNIQIKSTFQRCYRYWIFVYSTRSGSVFAMLWNIKWNIGLYFKKILLVFNA